MAAWKYLQCHIRQHTGKGGSNTIKITACQENVHNPFLLINGLDAVSNFPGPRRQETGCAGARRVEEGDVVEAVFIGHDVQIGREAARGEALREGVHLVFRVDPAVVRLLAVPAERAHDAPRAGREEGGIRYVEQNRAARVRIAAYLLQEERAVAQPDNVRDHAVVERLAARPLELECRLGRGGLVGEDPLGEEPVKVEHVYGYERVRIAWLRIAHRELGGVGHNCVRVICRVVDR